MRLAKLSTLFFFFVTAELIVEFFASELSTARFFLKPLPIILLLFHALFQKSLSIKSNRLLLLGLLFSLGGDILLLFQENNTLYFIFGLVSFLTAHVFYILTFRALYPQKTSISLFNSIGGGLTTLVFIGYSGMFYYILYDRLGELKIPVLIYVLVILRMLLGAAVILFSPLKNNGKLYLFIGAMIFVVSDSILAVNKFHTPVIHSGVLIMLTYYVAQFCIVRGVQKLNRF